MNPILRRAALRGIELIYPKRAVCMGCGAAFGCDVDWLCNECREQLARSWIGAVIVPPDGSLDGAAYAYDYRGAAGGLVRNLKYRGVYRLADDMAAAMVRAYQAIEPTGVELVTPVPMHPKRLKRRGYNQSEWLARRVAARMNLPVECVLARVRNTPQQARLSGERRHRNVEGAFSLIGSVSGKRVLLIDDVRTTGATAQACAEVLRAGGAVNVYLLCFAMVKI